MKKNSTKVVKLSSKIAEAPAEIISFFSGAGFLDLGFEKSGFKVSYMNEIYPPFMEAYKFSRKKMGIEPPEHGYHQKSIEEFLKAEDKKNLAAIISKIHNQGKLVGFIGGPPCPDFSVGGKNRGRSGDNGRLSETYVDIIIQQKPDFFIFENVKGLWRTKKHREFYDYLKKKLTRNGYVLHDKLINALSYGAPQDRDRIILFGVSKKLLAAGSKLEFPWNKFAPFPERTAFDLPWPSEDKFSAKSKKAAPKNIPVELTIEHWFQKNGVYTHPNSQHSFRPQAALAKFKVIPEGDVSKKSYKRLHRWRYSPTACYGNNEVHLHPYLERRLSAAEALAIQSLPADFELPSTMTLTDMFKTIGNGVPFVTAQALARSVKDYLEEAECEKNNSVEYRQPNRKTAQK